MLVLFKIFEFGTIQYIYVGYLDIIVVNFFTTVSKAVKLLIDKPGFKWQSLFLHLRQSEISPKMEK